MYPKTGAFIAIHALLLAWPALAPGKEFSVTPAVTVEGRWDSNVNFTKDGEKAGHDFITSAAPQIILSGKRTRFSMNAFYRLEADYHSDHPDLDYIAHSAGFDSVTELSKRMKLGLGDRFDFTRDSLQATSTGILVARTDITANTAYADLNRRIGRSTDIGLGLSDSILSFKDPALIDTRTDSATLSAGYGYDKQARARLAYAYTDYHFNNPGKGKDVETHGFSIGVVEQVSPVITLDITAGIVYAPELRDTIMTANGGLTRAYKDSNLKLAYRRDLTIPNGLTDEINISDRVGFEWSHMIDRTFGLSLFGGIAKNRSEPSRRVDINSYDAGITGSWHPYRWMAVNAGLLHFQQWAGDDIGAGLTRSQAFVNVTLTGHEWRF